jgi:DNA polymerase beta
MDYKTLIVDALETMYKKEVAEKQTFKARAYAKVITQVKALPAIISYIDVAGVAGIGDKIKAKILEILATGTLVAAENAKKVHNFSALDAFQNIYGVGPTKAKELIKTGINTIEQLRERPDVLNEKQQIGLKYYESLLERIPRVEMLEHKRMISENMLSQFEYEIVGSFRRGAESSGDIDVLIKTTACTRASNDQFRKYVQKLQEIGYITDVLAQGDKKCMAICKIAEGKHRRLDLLLTPEVEYAYAILYFTGSDKFNVAFRQHALDSGYTLNEHKMLPTVEGKPVPPTMTSERDIFDFLKLKFIEPEYRVDSKQIISL